jgi:CheY-like chemotaxis protein
MARVLIVDDSTIALELLRNGLSEAGYEVEAASNLAQLSAALAKGPFDAVVTDLEMPEAAGDDLLEFLREARGVRAPLFLYSDCDERELAARAARARAAGHAHKASGPAAIVRSLKEHGVSPAPPRRGRVMIVDDSDLTAKLIEAELEGKGFEIVLADGVEQATRLIIKRSTRPDLVLLDVNMPNVDGALFCRFIKGNSLFKGIKVLLCSGMDPEQLRQVAATCGADGFVAKDSFLSRWVLDQIELQEQEKKNS